MHTPEDLLVGTYTLKRLVSVHSSELTKEGNERRILIHISVEYREHLVLCNVRMQTCPDEGTLGTLTTPTSLFLMRTRDGEVRIATRKNSKILLIYRKLSDDIDLIVRPHHTKILDILRHVLLGILSEVILELETLGVLMVHTHAMIVQVPEVGALLVAEHDISVVIHICDCHEDEGYHSRDRDVTVIIAGLVHLEEGRGEGALHDEARLLRYTSRICIDRIVLAEGEQIHRHP